MPDPIKTSEIITPAASPDVVFTEKVNAVDTALKSRSTAQKDIKQKWAVIVKLLVKHGQKVPGRRLDASGAANLVGDIEIYVPKPDELKDREMVKLAQNAYYQAHEFLRNPRLLEDAEKKFGGLTKYLQGLIRLHDLEAADEQVDEAKTQAAQAEVQAAVDAYNAALEAYDETVEQVADVKEYIGVVKDVAEISAISKGTQVPPRG